MNAILSLLVLGAIAPERHHVAGAVIAIVRQGQAPVVKSYGMADVGRGEAVDGERTAFRTASVSKVITAAVVSRLVEAGKLDVGADVNGYLDFRIPAFAGKGVTLAQLLTHTAGFDDRYIGKSARSFETALPLGAYLKGALPRRIVPPGEVFIYSNYGVALAGYIAERVAGKPFAELARSEVFEPLGMTHSSFGRLEGAAVPYEWTGAAFRALPVDYLQDAPAGMMVSSGGDMARLIQWVLAHPERPELQPQFTQNPRLEGAIGWAWELGRSRGHAYAGHDGGYPGAVARVRVFPAEGVGYFIAGNGLSGAFLGDAAAAVEEEILGAAGPVAAGSQAEVRGGDVQAYAGVYRDVRYSHDTLVKTGVLLGFIGGELTIGATPEGWITMPKLDGSLRRMAEVEPGVFRSLDDDYWCAFRRDGDGRVTHLFTGGTAAMERVAWVLSAPVQRAVFVMCAFVLVLLMIGPVRRWLAPDGDVAGWAANLFGFQLMGLGLALQVIPSATERAGSYMYGLPWPVWIAQTLGVAGAACAGWYLVSLVRARSRGILPWAVGLALSVYVAWLWNWRLLGYWF